MVLEWSHVFTTGVVTVKRNASLFFCETLTLACREKVRFFFKNH